MYKLNTISISSDIRDEYFDLLNYGSIVNGDKVYDARWSLINRIKNYKNNCCNKKIKSFFSKVIDPQNDYIYLRELLLSEPNKLIAISNSILKEFSHSWLDEKSYISLPNRKKGKKGERIKVKKTNRDIIFDAFNYPAFRNSTKAYWLAETLNVKACPYCNRQFTLFLEYKKRKRDGETLLHESKDYLVLCDFDHFFGKKLYPYLSISLFNLIPSCSICNSRFKRDDEFLLEKNINPYIESLDKYMKFVVVFSKSDKKINKKNLQSLPIDFFYGNFSHVYLKLEPRLPGYYSDEVKKCINNIDAFCLEDLYNQHIDIVSQLVFKAISYNKSVINAIKDDPLLPNSTFNEDFIRKNILGLPLDTSDFRNKIFSKLIIDISEQLNLIRLMSS